MENNSKKKNNKQETFSEKDIKDLKPYEDLQYI